MFNQLKLSKTWFRAALIEMDDKKDKQNQAVWDDVMEETAVKCLKSTLDSIKEFYQNYKNTGRGSTGDIWTFSDWHEKFYNRFSCTIMNAIKSIKKIPSSIFKTDIEECVRIMGTFWCELLASKLQRWLETTPRQRTRPDNDSHSIKWRNPPVQHRLHK